jgi:hypothetical protein
MLVLPSIDGTMVDIQSEDGGRTFEESASGLNLSSPMYWTTSY